MVDADLNVLQGEPYSNVVQIQVAGREHSIALGSVASNSVWVSS